MKIATIAQKTATQNASLLAIEQLPPGRYVIAVSGGVDSMVLLDLLAAMPGIELIVAHFNHGIRGRAATADAELVTQAARAYGLAYEAGEGHLGPQASEAMARTARYEFLHTIRKKYQAAAIITAHHQGDLLETLLINLVRGTGWRGLMPLRSYHHLHRPLLAYSKLQLYDYARSHHLEWHEDATNHSPRYLRNRIRQALASKTPSGYLAAQKLRDLSRRQLSLSQVIETERAALVDRYCRYSTQATQLQRYDLIMLPSSVALELLQAVAEEITGKRLLTAQSKNLWLFAKTGRPGTHLTVGGGLLARLTKRELIVCSTKKC